MKRIFLISFLLLGCQQSQAFLESADVWLFRLLGRSVLSNINLVKIKDMHLNNSALLGKTVIVGGVLQEVGEHSTYLVLADNSARLLVKLNDLPQFFQSSSPATEAGHPDLSVGTSLRVFGVVNISRKGHPYVLAQALKPLAAGDRT